MASYPSSVTSTALPPDGTAASPYASSAAATPLESSSMIPSTPPPSPVVLPYQLQSSPLEAAAAGLFTSSSALASNVQAIGAMWMISSAFFTTYSTTKFLKYSPPPSSSSSSTLRSKIRVPTTIKKRRLLPFMLPSSATTSTSIPNPKSKSFLPRLSLSRSTLLTLYRFSGSLLLGILIGTGGGGDLKIKSILARIQQTYELCPPFVVPALFLFIANYANTISLNRIGISLTYVTKCGIPLFTVLLTAILDGMSALPSLTVLMTLVPIAGGIATASWNHPTFELLGFLAALTSCTAQAALNVSCKKTMSKLGVSGPVAQRSMVAVGLIIAIVYSAVQLMASARNPTTDDENDGDDSVRQQQVHPPAWLTMSAVLAYHIEYMLSFIFVQLVAPVTYSACDAVRRLAIIVTGQRMFGGQPFTAWNKFGISCALLGALAYSILNR